VRTAPGTASWAGATGTRTPSVSSSTRCCRRNPERPRRVPDGFDASGPVIELLLLMVDEQ
jgi:hypothetical protein